LRLFIGIPLGGRCQREIDTLLRTAVPARGGWRMIPEQNRHLTLAFLGDLEAPVTGRLERAFAPAYRPAEAFVYRFTALERFPSPRAGLLALTGAVTPPLEQLVQTTRNLLQEVGVPCEQSPFRPHITLARRARKRQSALAPGAVADIAMEIDSVALYQSTLGPSGSAYTVLARTRLGRSAAP